MELSILLFSIFIAVTAQESTTLWFFSCYLIRQKEGLVELIVLIKRVIQLKTEPAYKITAIANQNGRMIPSV